MATPVDSDSDHEPTSTVTIPTPPRSIEQEEQNTTQQPEVKTEVKTEIAKPRHDPRLTRGGTEEAKVEKTEDKEEEKESPITVENKITSISKESIVWEGNINMIDVAKFIITLHEVNISFSLQ